MIYVLVAASKFAIRRHSLLLLANVLQRLYKIDLRVISRHGPSHSESIFLFLCPEFISLSLLEGGHRFLLMGCGVFR